VDYQGDRGIFLDAGGFEGFPVDDEVGAGDIAEEVDDFAERDGIHAEFPDGGAEGLAGICGRDVGGVGGGGAM